ncbi:hypothetical protein P7245_22315 [Vibrio parahaemolyticus]|nr:hypothetical protein [Vibrio parahaemolyticus]
MSWSSDGGWTVNDVQTQLTAYYEGFKLNGYPDLSYSDFEDSREYEVAYMSAQIDASIDTVFAEIFSRLSNFIRDTNDKILNPTTTPNSIQNGIYETFGYRCSVKPMIEADAGKIHIAIDHGDISANPDLKFQIGSYLEKNSVVGSSYCVGDIEQLIPLSSGGSETYRWTANVDTPITWKITITRSRISVAVVDSPEAVQEKFLANWDEFYWIGQDVEPERYLEIVRDCPYASNVLSEYSLDDGSTWQSAPILSEYNIKYIPDLQTSNIIFE